MRQKAILRPRGSMWEVKLRTMQDGQSRSVTTRAYKDAQFAIHEARDLAETYPPWARDEWLRQLEDLGRGALTSRRSA